MYMYFDWWTRQQWNPPIFINIVQEAQRISECHTEENVTLSGLLKAVLKTLPAHNKTTYMQIHVLFVYMIKYMYSYFLFFISDEINLKGHNFILFKYPCITVSKIGQMLFDIISKNLKKNQEQKSNNWNLGDISINMTKYLGGKWYHRHMAL